MYAIPDVVTHIFNPRHAPFCNLCSLADLEAEAVLEAIRDSGLQRIGRSYLERRRATEQWLAQQSERKVSGRRRSHPIYFFLGDYSDGTDLSRPDSIVIPLASFPPEAITFTYPDSMASLAIARRPDHAPHRKPYHGQVFTFAEIKIVVAQFGLPGRRWETDPSMRYDRFIEMQLWDDRPIVAWTGA